MLLISPSYPNPTFQSPCIPFFLSQRFRKDVGEGSVSPISLRKRNLRLRKVKVTGAGKWQSWNQTPVQAFLDDSSHITIPPMRPWAQLTVPLWSLFLPITGGCWADQAGEVGSEEETRRDWGPEAPQAVCLSVGEGVAGLIQL